MKLYVGCPIWAYKGWVGSFYPEGTKRAIICGNMPGGLQRSRAHDLLCRPRGEDLTRMGCGNPGDLPLLPKLPRTISHAGKLVEHIEEAMRFIEVMSQLGERLGPMFLQLPPRLPPSIVR